MTEEGIVMKKDLCVVVVIGFLFFGSLSVAAETYTLGFIPQVMWSQYKVAEVKGFWEKQGVSVELVDYANPLDTSRGGVQRFFDITPVPMAVTALYRDGGVSDSVYLGTFDIAAQHKYLIIKKDLVNTNLKGQTIGIFLADYANAFLLSTYLKTVNTDLADVRLVEMNPDELEANFTSDRLQAVLTMDRANAFYEQADGVIAISTRDFYEPHGVITLKADPLQTIPAEDLKKILRGCIEAMLWEQNPANWEEYKAIVNAHILGNIPDLSDERFRLLLQEGRPVDPQILLEQNQQPLRDYFTRFRAFLAAEGRLKADVLQDFTYENVVHNQLLIEVLQEYVQ
jgi:ABC-type nitrate/sulfonate/bicarbonate transport system substrate-binding protein